MSSHEDRSDPLLRLARSVADGEPVDWDAASVDPEVSAERLQRLRILQSIASVCGMPAESTPPAPPNEAALFQWGRLEIREKVGEGAFGEVYRAWEPMLAREVAVKFLRIGPQAAPGSVSHHILQEGRNLARVRHPGVATVYGAEELDGRVGIWMEYVSGRTLEDLLHEQGPFGASQVAAIGAGLCNALAAVHAAGLVHRDIKTRNVAREPGGRIVLMDFGTGIESQPGGAVGAHALAGTPMYLAPEILRGAPATPQSDLYSLGVLLYRLLTGRYPVAADTLGGLRAAHERGEIDRVRAVRPDVPERLASVVDRALAAGPGDRFESAAAMERALSRSAQRLPHRRVWFGAGLGLTVAAIAVVFAARQRAAGPTVPGDRISVAVADIANHTQETDLDGLSTLLSTSLEQSRALTVVTRSRMADILMQLGRDGSGPIDEKLGREICRFANVGALIVPSVRKFDDVYTLDLRVLEPRRDEFRFTVKAEGRGKQRIPRLIDALAAEVRARFKEQSAAIAAGGRSVEDIVTSNLQAYQHYHAGERHIDRLEMAAARREFDLAVKADSMFGLAYCRLAYVDWWLSDAAQEKQHLQRALLLVDRIPEKERYRLRAHNAMAERQGLEAARSILQEMARFYPDDKDMLYDIGDLSSHLSDYPTAVEYLEKVLRMDPQFVRALQHLARTYRDLGRPAELLDYAARYAAVDSSPESGELLGVAQVATGRFEAGLATLTQTMAQSEERAPEVTMLIARAQLVHGDTPGAIATWRTLATRPQRGSLAQRAWREVAFAQACRGLHQPALRAIERALEIASRQGEDVDVALLRLDRAVIRFAADGDPEAVRSETRRSAECESTITYQGRYFEYWPYWGGLFKLQLAAGMVAEAEQLAARKFAADKWYGPYADAYLRTARGECAQAEAAAGKVLQWGPAAENLDLLFALAQCESDHGQFAMAAEHLGRLDALYTNLTRETLSYPQGLLLLGRVNERLGQADGAAAAYTKFLRLWDEADSHHPARIAAEQGMARLAVRH